MHREGKEVLCNPLSIKDFEWAPCDDSYTMDGSNGGPGVGFRERVVVNEQSVVISAGTGRKAVNWAKAGYKCGTPDPVPPVYAKKIRVTPIFEIYGKNLTCSGGFSVSNNGAGVSYSCTGSSTHLRFKINPASATCKAKHGVRACHYRYHDLQFVAQIEEETITKYCHSATAAFIGPNGDTYLIGVNADPRFNINCVEA